MNVRDDYIGTPRVDEVVLYVNPYPNGVLKFDYIRRSFPTYVK